MKRPRGGDVKATGSIDAPRGLVVQRFALGRDEFALLAFPLGGGAAADRAAGALTQAERAVMSLALRGHSNAEIARARGTSLRTVDTQLANIYRKLGVAGRRDLRAFRPDAA
jgi:DNA-binding CsgD family transcriptional regulator